MAGGITFGAFVPHGGANEFAGWEGAKAWERMAEVQAGRDGLFSSVNTYRYPSSVNPGGDVSGPTHPVTDGGGVARREAR